MVEVCWTKSILAKAIVADHLEAKSRVVQARKQASWQLNRHVLTLNLYWVYDPYCCAGREGTVYCDV